MFGLDLSDESIQILLFVCVPLCGLGIFLVVALIRSHRTSLATFATFSVAVNVVGREESYILYREGERLIEFAAQIDSKGRICAEVPKELSPKELWKILPNLGKGLTKLRRTYLVYRRRDPQPVAAEERDAAIEQLRSMGVELRDTSFQGQVQRAVIHNWTALPGRQAQEKVSQVQGLLSKARGFRESIEVLIESDPQKFVN